MALTVGVVEWNKETEERVKSGRQSEKGGMQARWHSWHALNRRIMFLITWLGRSVW